MIFTRQRSIESGLRLAKVGDFNRLLETLFYGDLDGLFDGDLDGLFDGDLDGDLHGDFYGLFDGLLEGDLSEDFLGDLRGILLNILFLAVTELMKPSSDALWTNNLML
jgi:hypothetical protein